MHLQKKICACFKINTLTEIMNDTYQNNDIYNKVSDIFKVGVKHDKLQFKKLDKIYNTLVETNKFTRLIHKNTTSPEDLHSGERQVICHVNDVRKDHAARYYFAAEKIKNSQIVLDAACGVGYGSYIMACKNQTIKFDAVDISNTSIGHAKIYFNQDNITHHVSNILEYHSDNTYDTIISFETIEHVYTDDQLIQKFSTLLKSKGRLIASVPNEDVMPFIKEKFLFHYRHYTPEEFVNLLRKMVLCRCIYYQKDKFDDQVTKIEKGAFIVCMAKNLV